MPRRPHISGLTPPRCPLEYPSLRSSRHEAAMNRISATKLLGLNLTPGKFRGLQRIANDNGTLTMVALDQNSSMISMIQDSLKKKGESREATYEEICEAKINLAKRLGPHC